MKFASPLLALALSALHATASPTPVDHELAPRATPTLYLCGDSTMAKNGAGDGDTDGWGQYIGDYVSITAVNDAIGGRSARSYWDEGRFATVAAAVKSGDIVVIEFGHNDGGSPESDDNGRSDCPGAGTETCVSDSTGATVYTFVYYVIQAAKLMTAKGATVILSSQVRIAFFPLWRDVYIPCSRWEHESIMSTCSGYKSLHPQKRPHTSTFH